jgi:diguanylate cyclase (GGDEF)-like protein
MTMRGGVVRSARTERLAVAGRSLVAWVRATLPRGNAITPESWTRRHRAILTITWLHVPALYLVGVQRGYGLFHPLLEVSVIALFASGAGVGRWSRDARASLATMGLVMSSGILVHLTGGLVEMHFHFFVVVAVVSLYQSWFPFLVAIGFVLLHHGVIGGMESTSVYNHPAALRNPWKWAALHAMFIAGESAAALTAWKLNELSLDSERAARAELEGAVADLSEAQALTHIGSWDWDVASNHLVWSDETHRICGVPRELQPTFEGFLASIPDEERDEVRQLVERTLETGDDLAYECHLARPDGTMRLVQGLGRTLADGQGAIRLVGTIQDMTERKQALHDPLTGLPNRTLFLDRVDHARTQQQRTLATLALLFVDLDNFKTVNDTKGHLVGDEVLREAGKRIGAVLRPGDTIARLGGDEFVVLLNGVDGAEDVTAVADRVLDAVASADLAGIGAAATASIGIVVEPAPGTRTAAELLRDADIAMYSAKRNHKGSWELFDAAMREDLQSLETLRSDLRRAVEDDELFLQYQPIVRLSDGAMEGVEALLRWRHPERGVVPPLDFIPLAEESGQIVDIGLWVLRQACRDAARWRRRSADERPFPVSVNVSPVQFRAPDFVERLDEILSEFELPPDTVVLEITEGLLLHEGRAIDDRLQEIRRLGVSLAIDDFGTGYSSLGYLHQFPIDTIKIDKVFIESITDGSRAAGLARAVVQLGHTIGLSVVAEGVETEEQAGALREMGCSLAQGYLFCRPVDVHEIDAVLDRATPFGRPGSEAGLQPASHPA